MDSFCLVPSVLMDEGKIEPVFEIILDKAMQLPMDFFCLLSSIIVDGVVAFNLLRNDKFMGCHLKLLVLLSWPQADVN